jgi:CheY-like chemotaxis protein
VKTSILILTPNRNWPSSLTNAIESYGYRVLVAPTAAIALGALRHILFDVLVGPLTDSTITGAALGTQAKLIQPTLRLVAIGDHADQPPALGKSFDAFVREPVHPVELHQAISAVVGR